MLLSEFAGPAFRITLSLPQTMDDPPFRRLRQRQPWLKPNISDLILRLCETISASQIAIDHGKDRLQRLPLSARDHS